MRLTSSRAYTRPQPVPKMPPGLMELMDGLARDVLMHNPTNVYEFCAKHMEKLLEIRDGPSSKESLTLEQKILKAQEKMRQKAQERRERFDREIKLHNVTAVPADSDVVSEDPEVPGPSYKAPIYHDLKDASEVEISHVSHVEKMLFTDNSNAIDVHPIKADSNVINDDLTESENQDSEIINDDQQENKIKFCNKIDDEPIFGKVESNENTDNFERAKLGEIADITTLDSPLQTITEASEENLVTDSVVVLPKITIGEDGLDPDSLFDESFQEMQSNIILTNNEDKADIEKKSDNSKSNDDLNSANVENKIIIPSHISEQEIIAPEFIQSVIKHSDDNELAKKVTQIENSSEIIQMSTNPTDTTEVNLNDGHIEKSASCSKDPTEGTNNTDNPNAEIPFGHETEVRNSDDGDLVNESPHKDTAEDKKTVTEEVIENSNLSEKIVFRDVEENDANLKAQTDVEYVKVPTETEALAMTSEDELEKNIKEDDVSSKANPDLENMNMTTENEANLKVEKDIDQINIPEIRSIDSNKAIDAIKIDPENNEHDIQKVDEEKLENDCEKSNNSNAEISLQKSESTENTNEDSIISMVESDLSKADDDSTQNNPNMDLETAAVTIQKVFRSFMFKSRNSTFEDTTNDDHNSVDEDNDKKEEYYAAANLNKERRPLGITRMDTVLQTVNEEKSLSLSTDDSSTLSSAATTIQAHVRGFLVRNRLNSSKTYSMNSLVNSHEVLEADAEQHKNKTILNIHIVPEEGNYLSRDESLITSMDLSLDGSPPSSVNLHPLSCDITERRKMLKREDAVQSVSPPSNNSGKLSEDSVKEVLIYENGVLEREPTDDKTIEIDDTTKEFDNEVSEVISSDSTVTPTTVVTVSKSEDTIRSPRDHAEVVLLRNGRSLTKLSSDEADVITPFVPSPRGSEVGTTLVHSGEFHDVVLPTKVSRQDTSAVRGE